VEGPYLDRTRKCDRLACTATSSAGLITLRLTSADPLLTAARLKEAVQASEQLLSKGCVVTVRRSNSPGSENCRLDRDRDSGASVPFLFR